MASDPKQSAKIMAAETPQSTNSAAKSDLPEHELAQVSGGFNPQPESPGDRTARLINVSLPAEKLSLRGN